MGRWKYFQFLLERVDERIVERKTFEEHWRTRVCLGVCVWKNEFSFDFHSTKVKVVEIILFPDLFVSLWIGLQFSDVERCE